MSPHRLFLALPVGLVLAFLGAGPVAAEQVRGSGTVRTESRPASGFDAVEVKGGMHVVLRQGSREAVEVRADDNILPLVRTLVVRRASGATLEIGPAPDTSWSSRSNVQVTVDLTTLKALTLEGSGDVTCDALKTPALAIRVQGSGQVRLRQLDADDLDAQLSGSGDLDVAGRTRGLALAIAGSGDVKAASLAADTVSVSIAGSGDASVQARRSLAVSIAGSGDVSYTGDATVRTSIAGSGTVTRR